MKRKLLSVFSCLALSGMAWAQTDVTAEYLVNPSFETLKAADGTTDVTVKTKLSGGLYGWDMPVGNDIWGDSFNDYQIESSESGTSSGFASGGTISTSDGNYYYFNRKGWGGLDTELKTTTSKNLEAGYYRAEIEYKAADWSNNSNAAPNGTMLGMKVVNSSEMIVGETVPVVLAESFASSDINKDNNTYFLTVEWKKLHVIFYLASESSVTISIQQDMRNSGRSDVIYDNLRLYKIDALPEKEYISGLVVNPTFDTNTDGWNYTTNAQNHGLASNQSIDITGNYYENWNPSSYTGAISQTRTGLPNGKYILRAASFRDQLIGNASHQDAVYVYAGDNEQLVISQRGKFYYTTAEVTDGTLEVGVKSKTANYRWMGIDNVQLYYFGSADMAEVKKKADEWTLAADINYYNRMLAEAKDVQAKAGHMKDKQTEALISFINGDATLDKTSITEVEEALVNLERTTPIVNGMLSTGLSLSKLFTVCEKVQNVSTPINESVKKALENAMTTANEAWTSATSTNEMQTIINDLHTALQVYLKSAYPIGRADFDMTFLVANAAVASVDGWTNGRSNVNQQYTDAPDNTYLDAWNATFNMRQDVYLPTGTYKLKAATRGISGLGTANIYINPGTNHSTEIHKDGNQGGELGNGWGWTEVNDVEVGSFTAVTLGFYSECGNNKWAGADDFHLYLEARPSYKLTVTDAGWATLILPFDTTVPEGLTVYSCSGLATGSKATLALTEVATIKANTPYIVQGEGTYSFEDLNTATETHYTAGCLNGTYAAMPAPAGSYVLQNQDGNVAFYRVGDVVPTVGAYRAYLTLPEGTPTEVNALRLVLPGEDDATAISEVAAESATVDVYSLSGVLVRKDVKASEALNGLQKGIYVVNGVKKAVK